MQTNLVVGQSVAAIGAPVIADGVTPSKATLSNQTFTSSDPTIFTVAPDPNTPGGFIITSVAAATPSGARSGTLTESALATEPDGVTTETIQGVMTVIVNDAPPPPPPPAASIVFTVGTPFTTPAA